MCYAQAVDLTILQALNAIAAEQAKLTKRTLQHVHQFLDYMATNPDAIIRYRASEMVLNVHSDASFQSASRARSRAGGYFFPCRCSPGRPAHQNKWSCPCTLHHPKISSSFSCRSRTGGIILQCPRSKNNEAPPPRIGPPPATHSHPH